MDSGPLTVTHGSIMVHMDGFNQNEVTLRCFRYHHTIKACGICNCFPRFPISSFALLNRNTLPHQ